MKKHVSRTVARPCAWEPARTDFATNEGNQPMLSRFTRSCFIVAVFIAASVPIAAATTTTAAVGIGSGPYVITPGTYWSSITMTCPTGAATPCTRILAGNRICDQTIPFTPEGEGQGRRRRILRPSRHDQEAQGARLRAGARPGAEGARGHAANDGVGNRHGHPSDLARSGVHPHASMN